MISFSNTLNVAICILVLVAENTAEAALGLGRSAATTRLPKPLSDMSASLGGDGMIYIAGGCDSPFGSEWDEESSSFKCNSVSKSFYGFDPETEEFVMLPDMPEPRHRHAAVVINNQVWLVGGRDEFDNVVGSVNVYDISDGRWRTFDDLYYKYWVSDLGGFSAQGRAFFLGGFTQDYRAVGRVFSIDPIASWETGTLQIIRHDNLVHRRGDFGVTVDANENFAYVSGGSTHTNSFCAPLNSAESYNLNTRDWMEMAPLQQERAGKTILEVQNYLVALGGAQQIRKTCNKTTDDSPSNMQTPVYEIEAYDNTTGTWVIIDNLSDYRSRSTNVVYNDKVYSFGGQTVFFSQCMCHPAVDDVRIYNQDGVIGGEYGSDTIFQPQFGEKEPPEEDPLYVEGGNTDGLRAESGGVGSSISMNKLFSAAIGVLAVFFL